MTAAVGPPQQQQQAPSEEADPESDDDDDAFMEVDGPSEPQDAEEKQNSKGENELQERKYRKGPLILFHWWSPSGKTFGNLRFLILSSKSAFVLFRSLLLSQIKKSYGFPHLQKHLRAQAILL